MNRLLFGDNLKWLRDKNLFPDASLESNLSPALNVSDQRGLRFLPSCEVRLTLYLPALS